MEAGGLFDSQVDAALKALKIDKMSPGLLPSSNTQDTAASEDHSLLEDLVKVKAVSLGPQPF